METNGRVIELTIDEILPNRFQPRIKFNEDAIRELADSIKEHGVIQPIVVRHVGEKYEIIAGERRYKASIMAGKATIPAIVADLNDKDSAEVALIENVQRQNLTPIEEAISYKKILDMGYLNQTTLADKLGKNQSTIANKLRLLELDEEVQEALLDSKISERHARSLLRLTNKELQVSMLNRIINERWTVRKADEEIEQMLNNQTIAPAVASTVQEQIISPQINIDNNISTPEPLTIEKPMTFESFFNSSDKPFDSFQEKNSNKENSNVIEPIPSVINNVIPENIYSSTDNVINPGFVDVDKIANEAKPIVPLPQKNDLYINEVPQSFNKIEDFPQPVNESISQNQPNKFFDIPKPGPIEAVKPLNESPNSFETIINPFSNSFVQPVSLDGASISQPNNEIDNSFKMKQATDIIKECMDKLRNMGYIIDLDEYDLTDIYQIIIKINK